MSQYDSEHGLKLESAADFAMMARDHIKEGQLEKAAQELETAALYVESAISVRNARLPIDNRQSIN